jgi:hypothetical protein
MGAIISSLEGATTVVAWPAVMAKDLEKKNYTRAIAGGALGGGAAYMIFGSPVPIVQGIFSEKEFVTGAFYYVTIGSGYLVASRLMDKDSQ